MTTRLSGVSETTKPTEASDKRLLIIDGHSMAFRAFYALPAENFATSTGQHTNAVHGFVSMLLTMIRQQKPTHVAVAFDLDTPTFRKQEYSEYKGGRNKTPEEFHGQIDLIKQVMGAMNIPSISLDPFEADDILATLATRGEDAGFSVLVVSGDRDAFQLITDRTLVLYPKKGISDIPPMDADAVEAKYFVRPERYSDLAALVGETADNLPGVPGVGPKTAAKWINQYGDLAGILENIDSIKGKVGDALREHVDNVTRNRKLNQLRHDLELDVTLEDMELEAPNREEIENLFDALEFNTLRKRLFDLFAAQDEESAPEVAEFTRVEVADAASLRAFIEAGQGAAIAVHPAVSGGEAVGLALYRGLEAVWMELAGLDEALETELAAFLADSHAPKIFHDAKAAMHLLADRGLSVAGIADDTLISAYLIQPDRRSHELAELVSYHLKYQVPVHQVKKGELDLGLASDLADPALAQAQAVFDLSAYLDTQLAAKHADALARDMELPLIPVLFAMERAGIAVNTERLNELRAHFTSQVETASNEAFAAIGHEVNLSSPKQLQVVLFEELDLPKTKKIKTGYTTDAESLQDLLVKTGHPFLVALMAYRDAIKLRQTVDGLLKAVHPDGRIHTTYAQTVAATGRLSSLNPNLQNIPVRSEEGRRIRDVFVVGEGYETLLTVDYSQIEMRIMAHLSGDEGLIQAYQDGEDLHRFVGSRVFNVEPSEVTSEMRSKVKAMSYGLAYGLSSFGLSKQLKIGVDEARKLMKDYFDRFGAVRTYLRSVVEQARKDGYTETIFGRRRYLPELNSSDRRLRDIAERAALNAPIQGSAADLVKVAMLRIAEELASGGYASRMLLQVHDELVLEIAPGELEAISELVTREMGAAADLLVPLDVQPGVGATWHEAAH
ncbi:DNA polymerase I [Glutamicibacter uratoxydans]|uniref:DNA polymerase I n=1 Tax=Glutamicibacter uratoxydans TaxID=43667 RepID=UPI00114196E8|nr:DNA polymerase I [Glutamicibacter uratoxydans]